MALSEKRVKDICKRGQAEGCCRYLYVGPGGWDCAKLTSLKTTLDRRVAEGRMIATGDNCEGVDQAKEN